MATVHPLKDKRDIQRMKDALHGRDLLLFKIGINSSLRISDILPLTREDFNGDHVRLYEKKTGKYKEIRINKATRQAIEELAPESGYLFPSRKGASENPKPITATQAWRILNAAAERAGLTINFGTHTMRKTFAYHAYNGGKGADITLLMRVLNHSSARETLRYIGIEQDAIDDVYIATNL